MNKTSRLLGILCVMMSPMLHVACSSDDSSSSNNQAPSSTDGKDGGPTDPGHGGGDPGTGGGGHGGHGTDAGGGGGHGGDAGGPSNPGSTDVAQDCVDKINAYRATKGLAPYARWTDGESCASDQAKSDSESGKAHGAFGQCGEWAQDECPDWDGPPSSMIGPCLKMMWDEGPGGGHYKNMSNSEYTQASCGFYTLPDGKVWAVQNFK